VLPGLIGRPTSNTGDMSGVRVVTMRPPLALTTRTVPQASTSHPEAGSTVRHLYEQTLKAFCHWLTRIFKSLNYDSCVDSGHRAVRSKFAFLSNLTRHHFRGYLTNKS
jgi:hypothetical protein